MDTSKKAVLLIADISGFTRFMRLHALSSTHARQIIARLLGALIEASGNRLQLAELEGDAAFFIAYVSGGLTSTMSGVIEQMYRLFQRFDAEIDALRRTPLCVCEACASVDKLELKQVVHVGDVSTERIDRFEKLFGVDVIVVHRLLKNTVGANRYALFSAPAYDASAHLFEGPLLSMTEDLEGIGPVQTYVLGAESIDDQVATLPVLRRIPFSERLGWKLRMHAGTLAAMFSLKRRRSDG